MTAHAVLETDQPINQVDRLRIEAHFAAHGIDALILPPGVRVAFIGGEELDTDDD